MIRFNRFTLFVARKGNQSESAAKFRLNIISIIIIGHVQDSLQLW